MSDDMELDTDDGRDSGDDDSITWGKSDQDIAIDSDDSEVRRSGSIDSSDHDVDLDEDDHWRAYSVDKADPVSQKFDNLLRRGLIPKDGILYKHLSDALNNILRSLSRVRSRGC